MNNLQEKLRSNLIAQEKRTAIWFMIIFYITIFGYDLISPMVGTEKIVTAANGVGLGYVYYFIVLLILIPCIVFMKKNKPEKIKYTVVLSYLFIYSIHEILIYTVSTPDAVYTTAHFFDFVMILFSPMFVNRKFFFLVSGSVILKYIVTFFIFMDGNMIAGTILIIILSVITFIILNRFVGYSNTVANSYQAEFELEGYKNIAYKDDLTGIFNKRYLKIEIEGMEKDRPELAIVMTDIDRFKSINDGYNHSVGDQALKHFVDTIKQELSEGDLFARYGGEEFTLILQGRSYEDTKVFVNKIREKVSKSTAILDFNGEKIELNFTASFGLYYLMKEDKHTIKEIQNIADNLLYVSKKNGRNRVTANKIDNNVLYNEESYVELPNE